MNVIAEPRIAAISTQVFVTAGASGIVVAHPCFDGGPRMSEIAWLGSLDEALKAAHDGERLVLMDVFNPG
jgi:hypothetical protein